MVSAVLLAEIRTRYAWATVEPVGLLYGGEWNRVVQVATDRGPVVLRVAHPSTAPASLAYSHAAMRFMGARFPQVAPPIPQQDGSTLLRVDGQLAALFPYLSGDRARSEEPRVLRGAARMLAGLHGAALEWPARGHPVFRPLHQMDWDRNHLWDWEQVGALLAGHECGVAGLNPATREELRAFTAALGREGLDLPRELATFREWIARLAGERPLATGLIHGDYYPDNLLEEHGRITGVLDWDECRPEWLVYELARATWEFCSEGESLGLPRARSFVQAYCEAGGPVPEGEWDLLVPFIRYTRLEDALFALNEALRGGAWDGEHTEYHLCNLRALRRSTSSR
ncbi:MAG TPA: phosphotransferase [Longimicrobium sp.]|nr:phosphotransferase [Longimicrobium sp.]